MRWLSLAKKDGAKDLYAVGFVTHSVAKVVVNGVVQFEAWRLGLEVGESVGLGIFTGSNAFELAKLAVENDARASSSSRSSANHSEHGTVTREASQGRSSSSKNKRSTAVVHGASFAPNAVES